MVLLVRLCRNQDTGLTSKCRPNSLGHTSVAILVKSGCYGGLLKILLISVIARDNKLMVKTDASEVKSEDDEKVLTMRTPLHFADGWSKLSCPRGRTPVAWRREFLSKDVLLSRDELISLLRVKLNLDRT